jgi:hypothetical protein
MSSTYVDHHVSNDFVVSDLLGIFFLGFQEAVEEVLLAFAKFRVLHALHKALDGESRGHREVIKFVKGARPSGVLAEPMVEGGNLTNLRSVSMVGSTRSRKTNVIDAQLRSTASRAQRY